MGKYHLWVRCAVCGDVHPIPGITGLDDGPALKASICEAYEGRSIPSELRSFMQDGTACPKCKVRFYPGKESVFLVPTLDEPGWPF
jgi:hypothetical protein